MSAPDAKNTLEINNQSAKLWRTVIVAALLSLFGLIAVKWLRQLIFPDISLWEQNSLQISLGTLICTSTTYFALHSSEKYQQKLARKTLEHLKVEKALREEAYFSYELFENANDIIYTLDPKGYFTSINKAVERIFGYTQDEVIHLGFTHLVAPEYIDLVKQVFKRNRESEAAVVYEIEALTKDRQRVYLEISTRRIERDGELIGFQGISRDITKRKRVEDELRASEEQYRFLAETVPQHVWTSSPEGDLTYGNSRAIEYFGKDGRIDYIGAGWLDAVHPEDQSKCYERWLQSVKTGAPYEAEYRLRRFDGEYRWSLAQAVAMRDDNGNIIKWLGTNTDVHDRKQAAEELRKSQQTLQIVVDTIPYTIGWKDRNSVYLGCNKHFAEIAGLNDPCEIVGKNDYELPWKKEESDFYRECDRRIMESGVPELRIVETIQQADGGQEWLETNKAPLRDLNEGVFGVLVTFENITERKKAEEARTESQKMIQMIIDAIPYSIFWKDLNFAFLGCNKHFAREMGFEKTCDLIGKTSADMNLLREYAGTHHEFDRYVIESGVSEFRTVKGLNTRDEGAIFDVYKIPLRDARQHVFGILCTLEDVTERYKSEKERKVLEEQLRQAQKLEAIGQLAAGVAHEINTPLQFVSDNTCFLKESFWELTEVLDKYHNLFQASCASETNLAQTAEVDRIIKEHSIDFLVEEIPKAIDESLGGIERVTGIVQSMKDFAHPGSSEMIPVNLNKSIASTITVARNEWKYVAEVETDFDPSLPPVECAAGEINQVILNIIINAVHAVTDVVGDGSRGKGRIKITTRRDFENVEIRISDTGGGIPVAARSKIFEFFFTTKEVGKGTGQGLAISHQVIVGKHHGSLTFETEINQGTTFIIRLPINQAAADEKQILKTETTLSLR